MTDNKRADYFATGEVFYREQYNVAEASTDKELIDSLLAEAGKERRPDRLYVALKLYHTDEENKNKDEILTDEARAALWSLSDVPVDINHGTSRKKMFAKNSLVHMDDDVGKVIGTSLYAKMVEPEIGENPYPLVLAAIYKDKFREEAVDMEQKANDGNLRFSFELLFKRFSCKNCEETFDDVNNVCEHLGTDFLQRAGRRLHDILHTAVSRVDDPADVGASSVALGERHEDTIGGNDMSDQDTGFVKIEDLAKAILDSTKAGAKEEVKAQLDQLNKDWQDKEDAFSETLEAKDTDIEKLQGDLKEAQEQLEAEQNEHKKTKQELEDFRKEIEAEKVISERIAKLTEAGADIPEDEEERNTLITLIKKMEDEEFASFVKIAKKKEQPAKEEGKENDPVVEGSKNAPNQKPTEENEGTASVTKEEKLDKAMNFIKDQRDKYNENRIAI